MTAQEFTRSIMRPAARGAPVEALLAQYDGECSFCATGSRLSRMIPSNNDLHLPDVAKLQTFEDD